MSTPTRNHIPLLFTQLPSTSTPTINPPLPTPIYPPPPPPPPPHIASFKPSVAVIVAALTTMFSLTFLLLLYAKHCKRQNGNTYSRNHRPAASSSSSRFPPLTNRRNSGVDRTVIDLLPVFRFGALQGQKDGLECAVCLNRFEPQEVLRLLPKCKHAFHVECVDTWLDAHSTCPLCRYRVDPEDILLVGDAIAGVLGRREPTLPTPPPPPAVDSIQQQRVESSRRISGRHSSAGERVTGLLKIFLPRRPSQDSSSLNRGGERQRRSLDSWRKKSKKLPETTETVTVGCFERQQRKDGLLLTTGRSVESEYDRRRLEHRIIIGGGGGKKESDVGLGLGLPERWSEVQGSDLVLLRTEMIMNESRRWSSSSGSRSSVVQNWKWNRKGRREIGIEEDGRNVIKGRSVSEITGISRDIINNHNNNNNNTCEVLSPTPPVGPVSRLLGWMSHSQS
ncbi:RING-H2 finger protein ATL43-like [Impatiens glandulifera]|uniref:RING-H2 finger protein ATL43-like n=1 Tax=Impatiens glandulifera TaxID=253017 RepID=UPI001FB171E1|nr:RING-H2 finger protein ATL43-like [Impatiens glandulifera]